MQTAERRAGRPPLNQVRTRTVEAGIRGTGEGSLRWSARWFQSSNRDDILFVGSEQTGFGYFRSFERTRLRGVELNANRRMRRVTFGGGTPENARRGLPGAEGIIENPRVQLFAQASNLLNRLYYPGAQPGPTGFTAAGAYVTRPFALIRGLFPFKNTTF